MKQIFSLFPAGPSGIALLLFRSALALFLIRLQLQSDVFGIWFELALDLIALAIGLGLLMQIFATVCVVGGVILIVGGLCPDPLSVVVQMICAAGLALIGPGAISIDAHLFGRTTIRLPD